MTTNDRPPANQIKARTSRISLSIFLLSALVASSCGVFEKKDHSYYIRQKQHTSCSTYTEPTNLDGQQGYFIVGYTIDYEGFSSKDRDEVRPNETLAIEELSVYCEIRFVDNSQEVFRGRDENATSKDQLCETQSSTEIRLRANWDASTNQGILRVYGSTGDLRSEQNAACETVESSIVEGST